MKKLLYLALIIGLSTACCCNDKKGDKSCCKEGDKTECCGKNKDKCGHQDGKCCGKQDGKCCCKHAKPIIDNILSRVSVRSYTGDTISCKQIETLLRCAMAAPTAVNKQPWDFVVVNDKEIIKTIGSKIPGSRCENNPACVFVLCGNKKKFFDKIPEYWIQDLSAATENLLLAAHAMGLGAVWVGVYPNPEREKTTRDILNLPKDIIPLSIIPVGVPNEKPEIKDKWSQDNIHYNKWQ